MRVYVLADNQQQFADWCARQRVNTAAAECVLDPFSLMGKVAQDDRLIDLRTNKTSPQVAKRGPILMFDEAGEVHREVWERVRTAVDRRAFDPSA